MRADLAELVHAREAAQHHVVAHFDVAGQRGVVGEDGVAADVAVVGDVRVGHDPVVVADAGGAAAFAGAAVDGDEFVEGIAVADHQLAALAPVFLVLRVAADRGVGMDVVVAPDPGRPLDQGVRADPAARSDLDFGGDDRERSDADVVGKPRARIDDRARMDIGANRAHRVVSAHISSQVAASLPSTTARAVNSPMPRSRRFSCTSRRNWSPGTTGLRKRALSTLAR